MSEFDKISQKMSAFLKSVGGPRTERSITEILITVGANTAPLVPIATSNLLNSQFRKVAPTLGGWSGEIGYGASYARYVHDAAGTLKGTNTPRSPARFGVVWGPDAEPQFLSKGIQLTLQGVAPILRNNYSS
jgi:hypothetical protein